MSDRVIVEYETNGVLIRCPATVEDHYQEPQTRDKILRITFSDSIDMVQIPTRLPEAR